MKGKDSILVDRKKWEMYSRIVQLTQRFFKSINIDDREDPEAKALVKAYRSAR